MTLRDAQLNHRRSLNALDEIHILGCGAKLDVVCFFFGKNELQNWYEESMKNLWTIIETCMVDGLEFTTWTNLWMTFPQQNAMAAMAAMACRAQGCFHRWTCPALRWAHWTSDWLHPFGPWNFWGPLDWMPSKHPEFFPVFWWGHMKLTSFHHRFPKHFPMKAPQKNDRPWGHHWWCSNELHGSGPGCVQMFVFDYAGANGDLG